MSEVPASRLDRLEAQETAQNEILRDIPMKLGSMQEVYRFIRQVIKGPQCIVLRSPIPPPAIDPVFRRGGWESARNGCASNKMLRLRVKARPGRVLCTTAIILTWPMTQLASDSGPIF